MAILDLFDAGASRVAVLARENAQVAKLRSYLARQRLFPRDNPGSVDFEAARQDIEVLRNAVGPAEVATHLVTRLAGFVPGLEPSLIKQVNARIREDGIHFKGTSAAARPLLEHISALYATGSGGYFAVMSNCLQHCRGSGHHVIGGRNVQILQETATRFAVARPLEDGFTRDSVEAVLESYAAAAAQAAVVRTGRDQRGLFVMTAHQAKGKEFDAVVVCDASGGYYPDTLEGRRLFYVAITRARYQWVFISPADNPSPLLTYI